MKKDPIEDMDTSQRDNGVKKANRNRVMAIGLVAMVAGMIGMSYAAVPLYQIFCQVTGYGGTTQRADSNTSTHIGREIVVRFDANIEKELGWSFKPKQVKMKLRTGETKTAHYIVKNTGSKATTGTASFNVSPSSAGVYFNKIDCFCFTDQTVQAGETIEMPVTFFVDPEIETDIDTKTVQVITLSYTFYASEQPNEAEVSLNKDQKRTSDVDG